MAIASNRDIADCDGLGWGLVIKLESDCFEMEVDPGCGGSVRSLRWEGLDLLRPAAEGASDPLQMACFPLAPFSNRLVEPAAWGPSFQMPRYMPAVPHAIHGYGWQHPWMIADQQTDQCSLAFDGSAMIWPQPFSLQQTFRLEGAKVRIELELRNLGDGPMPAGIGLHPYFPKGDCLASISLAGPDAGMWAKDPNDLPQALEVDHAFLSADTPVAKLDLDHSFSGWNGALDLAWPSRDLCIKLEASETLHELVIYVPDDDFFCIEPVSHLTNAANAISDTLARGWRSLDPGETLAGSITLTPGKLS